MITETTAKNIDSVLTYSFGQMLYLLKRGQELPITPIEETAVNTAKLQSIMFTIASSEFRAVVLLHTPPLQEVSSETLDHFDFEEKADLTYRDYICELGNHLCGVICRLLSDAGLSTGMSTPVILHNSGSTDHFRSIGHDYESHVGTHIDGRCLILASLCLFTNDGQQLELHIPIPSTAGLSDDSGELELF